MNILVGETFRGLMCGVRPSRTCGGWAVDGCATEVWVCSGSPYARCIETRQRGTTRQLVSGAGCGFLDDFVAGNCFGRKSRLHRMSLKSTLHRETLGGSGQDTFPPAVPPKWRANATHGSIHSEGLVVKPRVPQTRASYSPAAHCSAAHTRYARRLVNLPLLVSLFGSTNGKPEILCKQGDDRPHEDQRTSGYAAAGLQLDPRKAGLLRELSLNEAAASKSQSRLLPGASFLVRDTRNISTRGRHRPRLLLLGPGVWKGPRRGWFLLELWALHPV